MAWPAEINVVMLRKSRNINVLKPNSDRKLGGILNALKYRREKCGGNWPMPMAFRRQSRAVGLRALGLRMKAVAGGGENRAGMRERA